MRRLSDLPEDEARAALAACCASRRWVERMLSQRPFKDRDEVFAAADHIWWSLGPEEWREAFAAHPGKTGEEMLALCREGLGHEPDAELRVAAAEQLAITRIRLEKLLTL